MKQSWGKRGKQLINNPSPNQIKYFSPKEDSKRQTDRRMDEGTKRWTEKQRQDKTVILVTKISYQLPQYPSDNWGQHQYQQCRGWRMQDSSGCTESALIRIHVVIFFHMYIHWTTRSEIPKISLWLHEFRETQSNSGRLIIWS